METGRFSTGIIIISIVTLLVFPLSEVQGRAFFHQESNFIVKTKKGQIFDCVDFHKQPAFSNPLIKDASSEVNLHSLAIEESKTIDFGIEGNGCPHGTVPILRAKGNAYGEEPKPKPSPPQPQEHCKAVVRTVDNGDKFFGAFGALSINKPKVYNIGQWTASRIKLTKGSDSIEAGWMVNTDLFKDNEAHFYVKFTAGQNGCINNQCPGFVVVGKDAPLGRTPNVYGTIGGEQYIWKLSIDKHEDDGNWWVSIGDSKYAIGYWPKSLFTELANDASQVEFGGEVGNNGASSPPPDMGNSLKASYDMEYSAFVLNVTVVDDSFHSLIPKSTEKFADCKELYSVLDWGHRGEYLGRIIFYGGPKTNP